MKTFSLSVLLILLMHGIATAVEDPLPSWNDGAVKRSIVAFVERVTNEGSADFVPRDKLIATFDNDGTLWAEQPIYFQVQFALDRVKALAPTHPEWKEKQRFKALLANDMKAATAGGTKALAEVMAVSHSGMTGKEGKPIGIQKFIGRRPIFAFSNSDGDQQMLEWTAAGSGPRFMGLVHHTDAEREWAYDRTSHIGRLDKAQDEANKRVGPLWT